MSDTDNTKEQPDPEEDLLEGHEGEDEENLVVALSRGIGVLARTAAEGMQTVSNALSRRLPASRRAEPKRTPPPEDVGALLRRLGELVTGYQGRGYEGLEQDAAFWQLIAKLKRTHRRKRVKRAVDPAGRPRRMARKRVRRSPDAASAADAVLEPDPAPAPTPPAPTPPAPTPPAPTPPDPASPAPTPAAATEPPAPAQPAPAAPAAESPRAPSKPSVDEQPPPPRADDGPPKPE